MDLSQLESLLRRSRGQDVRASLSLSTGNIGNVRSQIDSLVFASKGRPFTLYNERMRQVLLGSGLERLGREDFLLGPRTELGPELLKHVNLDADQAKVLQCADQALGGLLICQGPPGTGKTHLVKQTTKLSLLCKSHQQLIIIVPTNLAADDLAEEIDDLIKETCPTEENCRAKYVVRLYAPSTERQYIMLKAEQARDQISTSQRSSQYRPDPVRKDIDAILDNLSRSDKGIIAAIRESRDWPTQGINDRRFTCPRLSLGGKMLEAVGVIDGVPGWPELQGETKFEDFWRYYDRYSRGEELGEIGKKEFDDSISDLSRYILQHASVIIGTTAGIASEEAIQTMESTATCIIMDENPREAEFKLLPLFAARFQKNPKILLVGDQSQLPPQASPYVAEAAPLQQCGIAFMTRMIACGHPYTMLTTNYRMAADICEPISKLVYGGKLINHSCVSGDARPFQKKFMDHFAPFCRDRRSTNYWLNTAEGGKNKTIVNPNTKSRSNKFNVTIGCNLALEMLKIIGCVQATTSSDLGREQSGAANPKADRGMLESVPQERVAIITMYDDQKSLYDNAKTEMKLKDVRNIENLDVVSAGKCQGLEWTFVILDPSISSEPGFVNDPRRATVYWSRARDGLIVIGDAVEVQHMRGAYFLKSLKNWYKKRGTIFDVPSSWAKTA